MLIDHLENVRITGVSAPNFMWWDLIKLFKLPIESLEKETVRVAIYMFPYIVISVINF